MKDTHTEGETEKERKRERVCVYVIWCVKERGRETNNNQKFAFIDFFRKGGGGLKKITIFILRLGKLHLCFDFDVVVVDNVMNREIDKRFGIDP